MVTGHICVFGDKNDLAWYKFFLDRNIAVEWLDPLTSGTGQVKACGLIVLKPDGKGKYLSADLRMAVEEQVKKGAGLIVAKNAAVFVPGGKEAMGWRYKLDVVPAFYFMPDGSEAKVNMYEHLRLVKLEENEILAGLTGEVELHDVEVLEVLPTPEGKVIALLTDEKKSLYGIIVRDYFLGKALYFSYDPVLTPDLFYSAIHALWRR